LIETAYLCTLPTLKLITMAVSTLKRKAAKNKIKSTLRNQKLKGTTLGSYSNPNRVARVSLSESIAAEEAGA
jgi:hypothetical protein